MSDTPVRVRLDGVRDRIASAARRSGRDPATVRLVAVSKNFSADLIRDAAAAGQIDFGENRVQEGLAKQAALSDLSLRWHLIGHLQSNKAKKAPQFQAIHSVDSIDLLLKIDAAAVEQGVRPEVLIQVDLAGEATKFGATPERLAAIVEAAGRCKAVQLRGLMTLPPAVDDPQDARPFFRRLRAMLDELRSMVGAPDAFCDLSMGMSHDFEVAIEEGATIVRVGSAIFGIRQYP